MFYAVKLKFYSNFRIFCNGTLKSLEAHQRELEAKHN